MRVVTGNKIEEINKQKFQEMTGGYSRVEIDLGTGDGRFVYKNALLRNATFFIGVDPAEKQLEIYSKKAAKEKVQNLIYVVSSFEMLPSELRETADKIYVSFPWGTLLENIVKPTKGGLDKLLELLKEKGELEIILGYAQELEPSETKRLNLPPIHLGLINDIIVPAFEDRSFHAKEFYEMSKEQLGGVETTWAKKLRFGRDRKIYKLVFSK
ncbi:MAG: class I SAM-dependent methyltransferase [Patescibacteria group bacterium]